jgi:hypothetical protein
VDISTIALEVEMRLRTAELRRDLERCGLAPPFGLRSSIAALAGSVRQLSERIERWAGAASVVDPAFVRAAGRHEWHNS